MSKKKLIHTANPYENRMIDLFRSICVNKPLWQAWHDFIVASSCAMANLGGKDSPHYEEREKEYEQCVSRLGGVETAAELMACMVEALTDNPAQDFLGRLFMLLELNNHWHGQFFTPYHLSDLMARMCLQDINEEIEKQGWCSVCDPCSGAGSMLIAAANEIKRMGVNYQNHVVFVGQDIDRVAGLMGYLQMSLLGLPGYIVIGNSLTHPMTGHILFPHENERQELWVTPMFLSNVWHMRRAYATAQLLLDEKPKPANKKSSPYEEK